MSKMSLADFIARYLQAMKTHLMGLQELDQSLSAPQTREDRIKAITIYDTEMRQFLRIKLQITDSLLELRQTNRKLEAVLQAQFLQLKDDYGKVMAKLQSNSAFIADVAQLKALKGPGTFNMDFDTRTKELLRSLGDEL